MSARNTRGRGTAAASLGLLLALAAALPAAAQDHDAAFIGDLPEPLQALGDFRWFSDALESSDPTSGLPVWGDVAAVGFLTNEGPVRLRNRTIRQRDRANNAVANDADRARGERLAWVVWNLAGPPPDDLSSDVVAWVGVPGADAVPFDAQVDSSLIEGNSFVSLIGRYGSEQGAPLRTADDSLSGSAVEQQIDFDIQGSGVGGYDPSTNSLWTSFVLPNDAEFLSFGTYATENGVVVDRVGGIGHTGRVPLDPTAGALDCAQIQTYPRLDAAGEPTGLTDIKVSLVEPADSTRSPFDAQPVMEFVSDGADQGARIVQVLAEEPPGSGLGYWRGVVPNGVVSLEPTIDGFENGLPPAWTAFSGVRVDASAGIGTAYGPDGCGDVLRLDSCDPLSGDAGLWARIGELTETWATDALPAEAPATLFPTGTGWSYCVNADETSGPQLALGLSGRPYTLAGHGKSLESSPCTGEPVDFLFGGVRLSCPDGSTLYSGLYLGDVVGDPFGLWGFRVEATTIGSLDTYLAANSGDADSDGDLEARFLEIIEEEVAGITQRAGLTTQPGGGFDLSGWRALGAE
jgi:hypothetical protein